MKNVVVDISTHHFEAITVRKGKNAVSWRIGWIKTCEDERNWKTIEINVWNDTIITK